MSSIQGEIRQHCSRGPCPATLKGREKPSKSRRAAQSRLLGLRGEPWWLVLTPDLGCPGMVLWGQDWQDLAVGGSGAVVSYQRQVGAGQFLNKKWPFQVSHPFKEAWGRDWLTALIPSIPSGLWQALMTSPVQVLIWKGEVKTGTCKPLQP